MLSGVLLHVFLIVLMLGRIFHILPPDAEIVKHVRPLVFTSGIHQNVIFAHKKP